MIIFTVSLNKKTWENEEIGEDINSLIRYFVYKNNLLVGDKFYSGFKNSNGDILCKTSIVVVENSLIIQKEVK